MSESNEPIAYVTCAVCHRIVQADHVNTTGRCVNCAGQPTQTAPRNDEEVQPTPDKTEPVEEQA